MNRTQITHQVLPDFAPDYIPQTVYVCDELGILLKIVNQKITQQGQRAKGFLPQIVSYFFDGMEDENIAYLHTPNSLIVNRISRMAADPLEVKS